MLKDSTTKGIPSDSRSSNSSQCRRLFFSCELPEVDGRGVLADVSFKRIVPASLMSFKRGRCSGDFEEPPSGKTKMHAAVLSVRWAVRKADRETCMAGKDAPPIGSHQRQSQKCNENTYYLAINPLMAIRSPRQTPVM
jgi:hypothetical protein